MDDFNEMQLEKIQWKKISNEGLNLDYCVLLNKAFADNLLKSLEETLEYFTEDLSRVKVFGKWHPIPRQQVVYGDPGITYHFSGITVPALKWPPILESVRTMLQRVTGYNFDFVLVNRYRDGSDHIGEHRDDEKELDPAAPIASLSLGQQRTFVLKHKDGRKPGPDKRDIPPIKVELQHGSLILMNPPTNKIWYHSLPAKKSACGEPRLQQRPGRSTVRLGWGPASVRPLTANLQGISAGSVTAPMGERRIERPILASAIDHQEFSSWNIASMQESEKSCYSLQAPV